MNADTQEGDRRSGRLPARPTGRRGAEATWSATDQVLGGGAVVTVTVRAVVSREDRLAPWPQRYVLGSGVAPVTWPVAP